MVYDSAACGEAFKAIKKGGIPLDQALKITGKISSASDRKISAPKVLEMLSGLSPSEIQAAGRNLEPLRNDVVSIQKH